MNKMLNLTSPQLDLLARIGNGKYMSILRVNRHSYMSLKSKGLIETLCVANMGYLKYNPIKEDVIVSLLETINGMFSNLSGKNYERRRIA